MKAGSSLPHATTIAPHNPALANPTLARSGGMGAVYLVEHVHTGDQLALKLLLQHVGASPIIVERFKREARAPAKIRSENVVKVTDADVAPELDGAPFLVMELLHGSDLQRLVEQHGALPAERVVDLLSQAARALAKAHALGIVHRDLKPENLFLHHREDGTEVLKVLDFGISKVLEPDGGSVANAGLTGTGAVMGTPLYMSPEQAEGRVEQIGPPTDVWALGLIAHHLLTADIYWTAQTMAQLMLQIVVEPMPPPSARTPALPPAFDAWFARACARDPTQRFPNVTEQIEALAHALSVSARSVAPSLASVPAQGLPLADTVATPIVVGAATPNLSGGRSDSFERSAAPVSRTFGDARPTRRSGKLLVAGGTALVLVAAVGTSAMLLARAAGAPEPEAEGVDAPSAAAVAASTASPVSPPLTDTVQDAAAPPPASAAPPSQAAPIKTARPSPAPAKATKGTKPKAAAAPTIQIPTAKPEAPTPKKEVYDPSAP